MKHYLVLIVGLFSFNFFVAQTSQDEVAATWKEGNYMWYKNAGNTSLSLVATEEVSVKFVYNDKGTVEQVLLGKDKYVHDAKGVSSHVRYFKNANPKMSRKIYFTGSSIVVFELSNNNYVSIKAAVGKTVKSKTKDEIDKSIESGKSKQAKDWAAYNASAETRTIENQQIASVKIVLIPRDKKQLESGEFFDVGLITTLENGTVMKTENLGGEQKASEYIIDVSGANSSNEVQPDFYTYLWQTMPLRLQDVKKEQNYMWQLPIRAETKNLSWKLHLRCMVKH